MKNFDEELLEDFLKKIILSSDYFESGIIRGDVSYNLSVIKFYFISLF
jgi:hypothetical protein